MIWSKWILIALLTAALPLGAAEPTPTQNAMALAQQGRIDAAAEVLRGHLQTTPTDVEARELLGALLAYDGKPDAAIAVWTAGLTKTKEDLPLLLAIGAIQLRRASEGPTVKHRRGSVQYSPSRDEAAEAAFKQKHAVLAVKTFETALALEPERGRIALRLCDAYFRTQAWEKAVPFLQKQARLHPDAPIFLERLGSALIRQGKHPEAAKAFDNCVLLDRRYVAAHRGLAAYYDGEGKDPTKATLHRQQAAFYAWLPRFVDVPYTDKNFETCQILAGRRGGIRVDPKQREKRIQALIAENSPTALGFLAALCWHHSDHGPLEDQAFAAIEKQGKTGVPTLIALAENAQTICTIRQSIHALARLQAKEAYPVMVDALQRDIRPMWVSDAAGALAVLGDERAVPELIKMADVTRVQTAKDRDKQPMNLGDGRLGARIRATFALGAFAGKKKEISKVLNEGLKNEQVAVACRAALYRLNREPKDLDALRAALEQDRKSMARFYLVQAMADSGNENLKEVAKEFEK